MQSYKTKHIKADMVFLSLFLLIQFALAQTKVIELEFKQPPDSLSETVRTLESLTKIQGTGQFCQDGLYLMTHYGDREELFALENQEMIKNPLLNKTWRHCSLYSFSSEGSVVMGRNWDNQAVGSIIVNLYFPPGKYASVSFTRSISLDFGHKDLERYKSGIFSNKLLLAPFYAFDGFNEHGLAVGVAGVKQVNLKNPHNKKLVYAPFLVRKILDNTRSIEEAVALVENYVPFDLDKNSLNTHFFITDATGKSVTLEYSNDQWNAIYSSKKWHILTNKPVYNRTEESLKKACWRYKSMSEFLEKRTKSLNGSEAIRVLQNVSQKGTTWSVAYFLSTREVFFSVYQNWDNLFHLSVSNDYLQ